MKTNTLWLLIASTLLSCNAPDQQTGTTVNAKSAPAHPGDTTLKQAPPPADAATILARKQVPVLCYHRITPGSAIPRTELAVSETAFREQVKMLADSGYHTVLPDELYNYLTTGAPLPDKPVMITFDDTRAEQYKTGAAVLEQYGFKGVFFMMTISINRPNYMKAEEIRDLADKGHDVASHTKDHPNVRNLKAEDWPVQIEGSASRLQAITGKPVTYFAYPFGEWNDSAVHQLKQRGMKAAFQLSKKRSETEPLYTIRRMIVPGNWSLKQLQKWMQISF